LRRALPTAAPRALPASAASRSPRLPVADIFFPAAAESWSAISHAGLQHPRAPAAALHYPLVLPATLHTAHDMPRFPAATANSGAAAEIVDTLPLPSPAAFLLLPQTVSLRH